LPELQVIPGRAATPSQPFDRFALGADARVTTWVPRVGRLVASAELVWSQNLDRGLVPAAPVAASRALRALAASPAVVQAPCGRGALGIRFDVHGPDADAREQIAAALVPRDERFTTLAIAAAWRPAPSGRITLEYDHNTNALGRTSSGAPTTLG